MKSAVAAAAGFLAVANAYQPRNFHWRRDNETVVASSAVAPEGFTTLTVEVTEIATVTSCKPTVTDCAAVSSILPADELEVIIVTNTVVLTETVCPISEAEEIESSVVQEHETGTLTGSTRTEPASAPAYPTLTVPIEIPLSTGPSAPAVTTSDAIPVEGEEVVTEVDEVQTTATLTLTLGRGSTASVVETVITSTFQTTVVKTITACPGGCQGGEKPEATKTPGQGQPPAEQTPEEEEEEEEEFTTTTTATTTGYTTVTVTPEATTEDNKPEASSPPKGGNGGSVENGIPGTCAGAGEQCLCPTGPAAVTVTIPASTVYVTITGSEVTPTKVPSGGNGNSDKPGNGGAEVVEEEEEEDDVEEDSCPADEDEELEEEEEEEYEDEEVCDEEDIVTVEETVTVEPVPYPTGANNGTQPSGAPAPTGAPYFRY